MQLGPLNARISKQLQKTDEKGCTWGAKAPQDSPHFDTF